MTKVRSGIFFSGGDPPLFHLLHTRHTASNVSSLYSFLGQLFTLPEVPTYLSLRIRKSTHAHCTCNMQHALVSMRNFQSRAATDANHLSPFFPLKNQGKERKILSRICVTARLNPPCDLTPSPSSVYMCGHPSKQTS